MNLQNFYELQVGHFDRIGDSSINNNHENVDN